MEPPGPGGTHKTMGVDHYPNRDHAARVLADELSGRDWRDPVVLGIPRGGVPMARIVAERLGAAFDVVLVHKIRAPGHPEYAIGSVDETGTVALNPRSGYKSDDPGVSDEIASEKALLGRRRRRYGRPRVALNGREAIIVDDGAATGATVSAAIRAARHAGAGEVVVALGVADAVVVNDLAGQADQVICPCQPAAFMAVSQAYDRFDQVTDAEVERLLGVADAARGNE